MMRRRKKKHSYILSLLASMILVASAWASGIVRQGDHGIAFCLPRTIDAVYAEADHTEEVLLEEQPVPEAPEPAEEVLPEEVLPEEEPDKEPKMYEADTSYFDDALFIGDSRTVGLHEYGDLGGAEVVADSGMNVYKIFEKEFDTVSGEKKLLETVLSERQFGKVYLMLGINELGYDFDRTVAKYAELVGRIREMQPDAKIFLEANLHITGKKSASSPVYTNENINRFNAAAAQMADNRTVFYLDVNELFDDENGDLAETYTMDNAHVLGKYYSDWVEWILRHAR